MSTITENATQKVNEKINTIQSEIQKALKDGNELLANNLIALLEALLQLEDMLKKDHRPLGDLGDDKAAKEVSASSSGSSNSTQSMENLRDIDLKDEKHKLKLLLEEIESGGKDLPSSTSKDLKALLNLFGLSEPSKSSLKGLFSSKSNQLEEL